MLQRTLGYVALLLRPSQAPVTRTLVQKMKIGEKVLAIRATSGMSAKGAATAAILTGLSIVIIGCGEPAGLSLPTADLTPVAIPQAATTDLTTTITGSPQPFAHDTSATLTFTSTKAGRFECSLDASGWARCTSPKSISGLGEGTHAFQVRAIDPAGNVDPTPDTYAWIVDTTNPTTTITGSPDAFTEDTSATLTFTSNEAGSFQCWLDVGNWARCTNPKSILELAEGQHAFQVRAVDKAGNVDRTPDSYAWTVDTTNPITTITISPGPLAKGTSAALTFTSDEEGSYECLLDAGVWAQCTSPKSISGLADGTHTFRVRAVDQAGNADPTPESYTWGVDATNPTTTITGTPGPFTEDAAATFTFTSNETGSFECRLDIGEWAQCTSPKFISGLTEGTHTLWVSAVDRVGNVDSTPESHNWTVDTIDPTTTITDSPPLFTSSKSISFTFSSNEAGSFECWLDAGGWDQCNNPKSISDLAEGPHAFRVRAIDQAENADSTPDSHAWTVDTTSPTTTITGSPPVLTFGTSITVTFASNEASSFECWLDAGEWAQCTSPKPYFGLADGPHTFQVRAVDQAGNVDPTPDSYAWNVDSTVDTIDPTTAITFSPGPFTKGKSATFTFTSNEDGSFECWLDDGGWAPCTSSKSYFRLAEGTHTLWVRAVDEAGNVDPALNSHTWTVDTTNPTTTITGNPPVLTSSTSIIFTFTSNEEGSFECWLDARGWALCASPRSYFGLAEGTHTFWVRAVDLARNVDPSLDSHSWTVETGSP